MKFFIGRTYLDIPTLMFFDEEEEIIFWLIGVFNYSLNFIISKREGDVGSMLCKVIDFVFGLVLLNKFLLLWDDNILFLCFKMQFILIINSIFQL